MNDMLLARRAAGLPIASPTASPEAIAFDSGHACAELLPDLRWAAEIALDKYRSETLQYSGRAGLADLRRWIATYLNEDGARLEPEEIMIVNGAKQGLELISRLLLEPGDSIVVTAPTYFTGIALFRNCEASFIEVGQDPEGIDTDELEERIAALAKAGKKRPKFIYDVPDFHNPTGVTMSRRRREALIDLARRHRIFVVEDSPYKKIRFRGNDESSLKALDPDHTVFGVGTFSKLVAPGLRVGWVATTRANVARMMQLKADGGTCPLTQRLIVEFCSSGRLSAHIERVRETYKAHCQRMVTALRRELPEASFIEPNGGYYIWLTLPAHIDGDELARRCNEAGVVILPGSKFFARLADGYPSNKSASRNTVRLAFSHASLKEIDDGIGKLATAFRAMNV